MSERLPILNFRNLDIYFYRVTTSQCGTSSVCVGQSGTKWDTFIWGSSQMTFLNETFCQLYIKNDKKALI